MLIKNSNCCSFDLLLCRNLYYFVKLVECSRQRIKFLHRRSRGSSLVFSGLGPVICVRNKLQTCSWSVSHEFLILNMASVEWLLRKFVQTDDKISVITNDRACICSHAHSESGKQFLQLTFLAPSIQQLLSIKHLTSYFSAFFDFYSSSSS